MALAMKGEALTGLSTASRLDGRPMPDLGTRGVLLADQKGVSIAPASKGAVRAAFWSPPMTFGDWVEEPHREGR